MGKHPGLGKNEVLLMVPIHGKLTPMAMPREDYDRALKKAGSHAKLEIDFGEIISSGRAWPYVVQ